ncbi:MAG: cobalamin biosynthesis protein CbiG [Anaerotruncus sp.]|nr:cobalamin biosynthesis protein CbiG [Anaerotruncus sp.]
MRISLVAFTRTGDALAKRLAQAFAAQGHTVLCCDLLTKERQPPLRLRDWTAQAFSGDAIVFVGACAIAVRAIAPFVADKLTDPAVLSLDEQGRFVIALLSGHVGGANRLAAQVAELTGGQACISTATDLNGKFAVDVWAKEQGLALCERELAKAVSAALLDGRTVGIHSDFPIEGVLPAGLQQAAAGALGISVALSAVQQPFLQTLHVIPRVVTLGVGCRKDLLPDLFEQMVLQQLAQQGIALEAVCQMASIDCKAQERCILAFCEKYRLPLCTASAAQLGALAGTFTASAFVAQTVGVDNVCERAAVWASGGRLIFPKQSGGGVTVAAAISNWRLQF